MTALPAPAPGHATVQFLPTWDRPLAAPGNLEDEIRSAKARVTHVQQRLRAARGAVNLARRELESAFGGPCSFRLAMARLAERHKDVETERIDLARAREELLDLQLREARARQLGQYAA